jgi:hypothetical protein
MAGITELFVIMGQNSKRVVTEPSGYFILRSSIYALPEYGLHIEVAMHKRI